MIYFTPFKCLWLILLVFAWCNTQAKAELGFDGNTVDANGPKTWAVLVAGSHTWSNYRHQADVCHAYQLLRARGIPESDINLVARMFIMVYLSTILGKMFVRPIFCLY